MNIAASFSFHRVAGWWRDYRSTVGKTVISLGIIIYYSLALIHQWRDEPLAVKLKEPTRTLCEFLGWVQNWHLFGPEIRQINFHTFGLIGYEDGTIGSWEPPRFDLMNLNQKFRKDKFHKWDSDCIPWDNYRDFWPGLARWVGRFHYDPKNKPVWFMLLRLEADIPDPTRYRIIEHDNMPPHTRLLNAFCYHYRAEDFR